MTFIMTFLVLGGCLLAMAVGLLITKKALQKGCSLDPEDCACRKEGKDPSQCDK